MPLLVVEDISFFCSFFSQNITQSCLKTSLGGNSSQLGLQGINGAGNANPAVGEFDIQGKSVGGASNKNANNTSIKN